jgi:hypothetical protein
LQEILPAGLAQRSFLHLRAASILARHKSFCRAIKPRATKRSIGFLRKGAKERHVLLDRVDFIGRGCALDRGQRMLELWNNWYETMGLAEALAIVIVLVVIGAGVITLAQGRRR